MQDDDDGHMVVLRIVLDLMEKAKMYFLDHFARLGLFSQVAALYGASTKEDGAKAAEDVVQYFLANFLYLDCHYF